MTVVLFLFMQENNCVVVGPIIGMDTVLPQR